MDNIKSRLAETGRSTDTAPNAAEDTASRADTAALLDMGAIESKGKNTITRLVMELGEDYEGITLAEWRQIRKAAGLQIDPETAEFMWLYARDLEETDFDHPDRGLVCREAYYRSPGSDEWVSAWDLPAAIRKALFEKLPDGFHR